MNALVYLKWGVLLVALPLGSALALQEKEKGKEVDLKQVGKLIEALGDDDVDIRRSAMQKLEQMGEPVLVQLRKAAKDHPDADVRLRAIMLQRTIERTYFGEIRRFTGHTGHIRSIAVSKDGKKVLTGSMDHTARLWDIETGKELQLFKGHTSWVWSVAFSPDEKEVLTSGALDKTLRLWTIEGKEIRKFEGHAGWTYGADISPDGKYVVSSEAKDGMAIRLFEAKTGKELRKLEGHTGYVWRVAFSPDGKKIGSICFNDKSFRIWDVETGKALVIGANAHETAVVGMAFSPDGRYLLTSGRDLSCKLWEVETGKLVRKYTGMGDHVEAVAFSPDGKRFLAGENKLVHVFDTETGKILHRFEDHTDYVYAVAWVPDGKRALSGGADNLLRLWGVPK